MKSYFSLFRNYANFSGFMKRGPYWAAMIIHGIILAVPLWPLVRWLADGSYELPSFYLPWVLPFWCFYFLLMIIPVLAADVRRLHTLPRKGWWLLIGLIPVIGWFILLIWLLQKGSYEELEKRLKKAAPGSDFAMALNSAMESVISRPRNGGWFFPVFILLAAGGWFLNRQIIQTGAKDTVLSAMQNVSSGGLASLKNFGKQPFPTVQPDLPVYLLEALPGEPVTSLKDGAELYLISEDVLASKYAVSYGQYSLCVTEGACGMPLMINADAYRSLNKNPITFLKENGIGSIGDYFSILTKGALDYPAQLQLPMVDVTAEQAAAYCEWAGMRLPTVSEWLRAAGGTELTAENGNCVGTDRQPFYHSDTEDKARIAKTVPVTAFETYLSDYGMVQMTGNVWEWSAPEAGADKNTALGGAWNSYPGGKTADLTYETAAGYSANNIGFRCFVDSAALTSDLFSDGKIVLEAEPITETETVAEAEVIEAEPVEAETESIPASEPETGSGPVVSYVLSGQLITKETEPAPAEDRPEETEVRSGSVEITAEDEPEEELPENLPEGIKVGSGQPVIAKQDGSILLLTADNVLASVYAVTVGQYKQCVSDGVCEMPEALEELAYKGAGEDADKLPVVYVTDDQAAAYCGWAGMRLPKVSEWKTAAVSAGSTDYTPANVNVVGTNRRVYIHSEEQQALTVPVTAFRGTASDFGMVQMAGNVWEWAEGDEDNDLTRFALGGAWNSYPDAVGPDAEMEVFSGYAADNLGFRCFADPDALDPQKFEVSDADVDVLLNPGLWAEKGVRTKDNARMIYIPSAVFTMGVANGAIDEKPAHEVTLSAYWIDAYEVTNAQYALCVAEGVCTEPHEKKSFRQPYYYSDPAFGNYPVVAVDRSQAEAYCEWAETRLPTEAEWEYAARGPEGNAYPWGGTFISGNLNYSGNGNYDTLAVNADPDDVSDFGVFDLGGNVSEWVSDRYQENWYTVTDQPVDPTGPANGSYYVIRGGSAQTGENNARTADRFYALGTSFSLDRGFRCAVKEAE